MKLAHVFIVILVFLIIGSVFRLRFFSSEFRQKMSLRWTQLCCSWMCQAIGVRLEGELRPAESCLSASNHLSYLDTIIQYSQRPMIFVTSEEVRRTPGLGWICRVAGCEFVDRENPSRLRQDLKRIKNWIDRGFVVHYYPEATSGSGENVLKFKRALFQLAVIAKAPVSCSVLNYRLLDENPVSVQNKDKIFWYGEMEFLPHLKELCRHRSVSAELKELGRIEPTTSRELSEKAYELVSQAYSPLS